MQKGLGACLGERMVDIYGLGLLMIDRLGLRPGQRISGATTLHERTGGHKGRAGVMCHEMLLKGQCVMTGGSRGSVS